MSEKFVENQNLFGQKLGRYTLLEKLGEGGMAIVYNAFDPRFEQNVAIKVILPSHQASQMFIEQFETEAKSLAQLSHTNIVKVLDYGEEKGQPFLVMEFMRGGTLKEIIKSQMPWQQAAAILLPIARALDYVHKQNLIHQDVKPANILLNEDDQPMLSDFGIAKLIESGENMSGAIGVGVGTPDYMSPEQGMGKNVDYKADIYALGVIFYELVTGRKPFSAETPMAVVIKHVTEPFPHPKSINKNIPKFVEAVILRAVQKDPEKRFKDMAEFVQVLDQLTNDKTGNPKKINRLLRNKKHTSWLNRRWISLAILTLVLLVGIFGYINQNAIKKYIPSINLIGSNNANENNQLTVEAIVKTEMQANLAMLSTTTPLSPILPMVTGLPISSTIETRTPDLKKTQALKSTTATPRVISTSNVVNLPIRGIGKTNISAWSPDGNKIALSTTEGIYLYQVEGLKLIEQKNNYSNSITDLHLLNINKGQNPPKAGNFFETYPLPSGDILLIYSNIFTVDFSHNLRFMAAGYQNGNITIWEQSTGKSIFSLNQYDPVYDLAFSGDSRYLFVANGKTTVQSWDIASRKVISQFQNPIPIKKIVTSSDASMLLMAGISNSGYLWDAINEKILTSFVNLGAEVQDIAYSPDNKLIAFGLKNGQIKVFRVPEKENYAQTHQPIYTLEGHPDSITSLSFSPTSNILASSSWRIGLVLWDMKDGAKISALEPTIPDMDRSISSRSGEWLAVGDIEGQIRIWNTKSKKIEYILKGYLPSGELFSPDSDYLAIARDPENIYGKGSIEIIRLSDGKIIKELIGFKRGWVLSFSPNQKLLLAGGIQEAIFWDVSTWEKIKSTGGSNSGVGEFYTLDKQKLAYIMKDGVSWAK